MAGGMNNGLSGLAPSPRTYALRASRHPLLRASLYEYASSKTRSSVWESILVIPGASSLVPFSPTLILSSHAYSALSRSRPLSLLSLRSHLSVLSLLSLLSPLSFSPRVLPSLPSKADFAKLLRRSPMFSGSPEKHLRNLAKRARRVNFRYVLRSACAASCASCGLCVGRCCMHVWT